jgi:acyl-CoA synthetase (AMP-forming)/AMP-acid ligase II
VDAEAVNKMDSKSQVSLSSKAMASDATYGHLYEIVAQRARLYPETIALGSQQGLIWQTVTSAQLLRRVNGLAERLRALGVSEGDRVVLWLPSSWWSPVY